MNHTDEEQRARLNEGGSLIAYEGAGFARRIWRGFIAFMGYLSLAALVVGIVLLVWATGASWAHRADYGWEYPWSCCAGNDCAQLPPDAVKTTAEGFDVTILPGQHPMVKDRTFHIVVPYADAKQAPNGDPSDHICLSQSLTLLCFFAGSRGI